MQANRPGRLDLILFIGAPDEKARLEIMKILTASMPLANEVILENISQSTKGFSGADLGALCREAAVNAMNEHLLVLERRIQLVSKKSENNLANMLGLS